MADEELAKGLEALDKLVELVEARERYYRETGKFSKRRWKWKTYDYQTGIRKGAAIRDCNRWRRICCDRCKREVPRLLFHLTDFDRGKQGQWYPQVRSRVCWLCLTEEEEANFRTRRYVHACQSCKRPVVELGPAKGFRQIVRCSDRCAKDDWNRSRTGKGHFVKCPGCGGGFFRSRRSQVACSDKCRQRLHRGKSREARGGPDAELGSRDTRC